jgi:hypothetical protein
VTPLQRQEVDRLAAQIPMIREGIAAILVLAEELKECTIETVLNSSWDWSFSSGNESHKPTPLPA